MPCLRPHIHRARGAMSDFWSDADDDDLPIRGSSVSRRGFDEAGITIFFRNEWSTFFGPQGEGILAMFPRGMYGKKGRLLRAATMLCAGSSSRTISKATGMHSATIAKLRKVLQTAGVKQARCKCGQLATHKGWCAERYRKSRKRQEFMRTWHAQAAGRTLICTRPPVTRFAPTPSSARNR